MVSVNVRYLFYQSTDEKIKTPTLHFRVKENPNMEKVLFDLPIVSQYDVKAKYRLISRKFAGMTFFQPSVRLTNRKPRSFVPFDKPIKSLYFRFLFLFCSCVFISRSYENRSHTSRSHTSNIVPEQLVQRVWPGELNPSPHS